MKLPKGQHWEFLLKTKTFVQIPDGREAFSPSLQFGREKPSQQKLQEMIDAAAILEEMAG